MNNNINIILLIIIQNLHSLNIWKLFFVFLYISYTYILFITYLKIQSWTSIN